MVNHFQVLTGEQQQGEFEKGAGVGAKEELNSGEQKNELLRCLGRNLQKIVTLGVLVYLLVLIVHLLACSDSFLTPSLAAHDQDHTQQLQSVLPPHPSAQKVKQNLLQDILGDASLVPALPLTPTTDNGIQNVQATIPQQHQESPQIIQPSIITKNQPGKQEEELPAKLEVESGAHSFKQENVRKDHEKSSQIDQLTNFVLQFKSSKQAKQNEASFSKITSIYENIADHHHRTINALSPQDTQAALAKFAPLPLPLALFSQNSQLSPALTAKDEEYSDFIEKKYLISARADQPLCLILSTHNNAHNRQIVRTLNSIYSQHYDLPFSVVIADRSSSYRTFSIINDYLNSNQHLASRTTLLQLETESEPYAVWTAAQKCPEDTLAVVMDGNTELLGKEVLKMFSFHFSDYRANVVYSDHYTLDVAQQKLTHFVSSTYDESEIFMLTYRNVPSKFGRIMGFKTTALLNLPQNFIKFNEKHFEFTGIESLAVSLLEMSCGKVKNINEPLALALVDSEIEKRYLSERKHEQQQIGSKLKMDIC